MNKFKPLFNVKDFEAACDYGNEFLEILKKEFPTASIYQNASQSSREIFRGSPGFNDDCDAWMVLGSRKIDFEITGDFRYTEAESNFLPFNKFSVDKLLSHGKSGFAVYYLAKEKPTKFFLKRATVIDKKYIARAGFKSVRGDDGCKYRIPVNDWIPLNKFIDSIRGLKEKV